ncbi:hypothetical protein CspeluHIS016_0600530 [Cutaneotrichosporon spelunceum]|uniref:Uncharacterized protein n=1 Tax=Cutaneotrichosporon spelunceum TaxID=1672016 RepID=A0AAD3YD07_9TREE|nr:hypothetical protein CspeluHIS016_0600530 [Cutaneotrichosporon spelunceum]
MLQALLVQIQPKHGNVASRIFPTTGYFGVTPVSVAGTVHVKLEQGGPQIPIRSVQVAVRCYESRDSMRSARSDQTIWETSEYIWLPPAGTQDQVLDRWEKPFKLTIPPEAAALARGTQNLREWRVRWRLEVMVEHVPIPIVGHRVAHAYDIKVYDHRSPSPSLPSPPAAMVLGSGATATHVHMNPPPTAFGPSESLPVSFSVRPDDPSASIKKLQLVLERRVELLDGKRSMGGSTDDDLPSQRRSRVHTLFRSSPPGSSRGDKPDRAITTRIAETQCQVPTPGESGAMWSMGSLQLPRRGHNWDIGETTQTDVVNISFEARLKVTIKNKRAGSQKELVSQPIPVVIVASTADERLQAIKAWERLDSRTSRHLSNGESATSIDLVSPYDSGERPPNKQRSSRRISETSEDDLPRSRLKREHSTEPSPPMPRRRLQLPSLDTLGLGLPNVKEERPLRNRPATAPAFGVYAAKPPPFGSSRPQTSAGFTIIIPAPRR